MLGISENVLFPGHNHLLTIGTGTPHFDNRVIIKVSCHQYWWLRPGNRTFLDVASMVVALWLVACLCSTQLAYKCHAASIQDCRMYVT